VQLVRAEMRRHAQHVAREMIELQRAGIVVDSP